MNKHQLAIEALKSNGVWVMRVYGNSMTPRIQSGSLLTFRPFAEYEVGDVVFCKVRGRYIDAHKITKKDKMGDNYRYMISNNKGHDNGWTRQIYGKVVKVQI